MLPKLLRAFFPLVLAAAPALAGGDDWRPIDFADPSLKSPVVEKNADAEAMFWEIYLDDARGGLELSHYVRIKIFTDRGRELHSKIELPYSGNIEIKDISARTIKPDGSIVELAASDIIEKNVVSARGVKVKAKSFVLPAVETGAIIEYRWRRVEPGRLAHYVRLPFQRDIPVQRISYYFRPKANVIGAMRFRYFHMAPTGLVGDGNGFYSSTRKNVPAFRNEPRSPPEDQIRPWLLVYYVREQRPDTEKFWKDLGKGLSAISKEEIKADDGVRKAAQEAIGNATSADEKLRAVFDYCRARVKNIYSPASGMSAAERAKRKENKTPSDTLKRGLGTGLEIDKLFASLVSTLGFESRLALLPDRSDIFFDPGFPDAYFMNGVAIAVKVGEQWRFFDPGNLYLPYGMLPWWREGEDVLVPDENGALFVKTPLSPPERSRIKRRAVLRLSEDGMLEGEVQAEYSGHLAAEKKWRSDEDSVTQLEKVLRDEVKSKMSTAEASEIHVQVEADPTKPVVYAYHVRIPGYAQRTGRRVFLQPAFFEHGIQPLFSAGTRQHQIYFNYPWSEADEVTIELPRAYAVEGLDEMQPSKLGTTSEYKSSVAVSPDGRVIVYKRSFFFGAEGTILFPASEYTRLKDYFDALHKLDNYTLTLTQRGATGSN